MEIPNQISAIEKIIRQDWKKNLLWRRPLLRCNEGIRQHPPKLL